jgi:ABC-type dipeptide/oligopeptide/nickel transport system permease subunit
VLAIKVVFSVDPYTQDLSLRFQPPELPFYLGTDHLGRSLGARLYLGFLNSCKLILLTMFSTLSIGIPMGLLGASKRSFYSAIDAIAGAIWSLPTFIIGMIVFIGMKGRFIELKFLLLGFFNWVPVFRATRDVTLDIKRRPYVTFYRAMGMPETKLYALHILPNVLKGTFPTVLLNIATLFEAEFVLSFLGLSYPDPVPTLGGILRQGIEYLSLHMVLLPALLIGIIIFCFVYLYQKITIGAMRGKHAI